MLLALADFLIGGFIPTGREALGAALVARASGTAYDAQLEASYYVIP